MTEAAHPETPGRRDGGHPGADIAHDLGLGEGFDAEAPAGRVGPFRPRRTRIPPGGLSPKKLAALAAILSAPTMTEAARVSGCGRRSIYRWRATDPAFRALHRAALRLLARRAVLGAVRDAAAAGDSIGDIALSASRRAASAEAEGRPGDVLANSWQHLKAAEAALQIAGLLPRDHLLRDRVRSLERRVRALESRR